MGAPGCANTFDSDTKDNVNIIKKHRIDFSIIFPLRAKKLLSVVCFVVLVVEVGAFI